MVWGQMEYYDRLPRIAELARSRAGKFELLANNANKDVVLRLARAWAWIHVAVDAAKRNMELLDALERKRAADAKSRVKLLNDATTQLKAFDQEGNAPELDKTPERKQAVLGYARALHQYQETLLQMEEGTRALSQALLDEHYEALQHLFTYEDHERLARVGKVIREGAGGSLFSIAAAILFGPFAQPVITAGREIFLTIQKLKAAYQKDMEVEDVHGANDLFNQLDDFEFAAATWVVVTVIFSSGTELVLKGVPDVDGMEQFKALVTTEEATDVILSALVDGLRGYMAPMIKAHVL